MTVYKYISSDPMVMQGQPCIAGTRITVSNLVHQIGAGRTVDEICADYEIITPEQIREALSFASNLAAHEEYRLAAS
jgi:uncharacterized protein (DUF433 family)